MIGFGGSAIIPRTTTAAPLLGLAIAVQADITSRLTPFLDRDILPALGQATGETFTVNAAGQVSVTVNPALATQEYRITATSSGPVTIEGGSWRGCKHGLYAWLRELGVNQLAPGPRWRTMPTLTDLRRALSIRRNPSFTTAAWQVQGPDSGAWYPWADPDQFVHPQWYEWLDWNGRPLAHYTDITATTPERQTFGGHFDNAVWNAKFGVLESPGAYAQLARDWAQSTTYYAGDKVTANGKRYTCAAKGISAGSGTGPSGTGSGIVDGTTSWNWLSDTVRDSPTGNFHHTHGGPGGIDAVNDYSTVTGLVQEYADVHLGYLDANVAAMTSTYSDLTMTLGCAVGDGAPTCLDAKCINLLRNVYAVNADARPSDLTVHRASRIWDRLRALRPSVTFMTTDLAYDRESVPPQIPVSDNVFIEVANWRYQVDGYANSLRLEGWASKATHFGVYDYWCLPAHDNSSARFSVKEAWRRARDVLALGGESFHTETTVAAGAVGLHWWGLLQIAWRGPNVMDATLINEWCALAFGAGATHVERMLTRWWTSWPGFVPNAYEFGLAFEDLRLADAAVTGDAAARSRVAAMQVYLIYLHYRYRWYDLAEYAATPPTQAAAEALAEEYLRFLWNTALTVMVDAKWASDIVLANARLGAPFKTDWAVPGVVNQYAGWRTARGITTYTDAQIRTTFETIRATYAVPTPASYATPSTSLVTPAVPSATTRIADNWLHGDDLAPTGQEYIFEKRTGSTRTLDVMMYSTQQYTVVRIRLYNATTGALLSTTDVDVGLYRPEDDGPYVTHSIDLSALSVGYYRLVVEHQAATTYHAIKYYRDVPLAMTSVCSRVNWNVSGSPPGNNGYYARYFWVPAGVTAFHLFSTTPNDTAATTLHVRNGDDVEVTPTMIGDYVYRYAVAGGQSGRAWVLEGNLGAGPAHGASALIDLPNWFAPTREQLIVQASLT